MATFFDRLIYFSETHRDWLRDQSRTWVEEHWAQCRVAEKSGDYDRELPKFPLPPEKRIARSIAAKAASLAAYHDTLRSSHREPLRVLIVPEAFAEPGVSDEQDEGLHKWSRYQYLHLMVKDSREPVVKWEPYLSEWLDELSEAVSGNEPPIVDAGGKRLTNPTGATVDVIRDFQNGKDVEYVCNKHNIGAKNARGIHSKLKTGRYRGYSL